MELKLNENIENHLNENIKKYLDKINNILLTYSTLKEPPKLPEQEEGFPLFNEITEELVPAFIIGYIETIMHNDSEIDQTMKIYETWSRKAKCEVISS
jgi:hypothetical protein